MIQIEKENVDFRTQREERDSKERQAKKKAFKALEEQKKIEDEMRKAEAELRYGREASNNFSAGSLTPRATQFK